MMKIFKNPLFLVFFTLCAIVFSLSMLQSKNTQEIKNEREELELQNALLEQKKVALEFEKRQSVKKISQEKIIRDEIWHQKPDEKVLRLKNFEEFVAADEEKRTEIEKLSITASQKNTWNEWWLILRGK